MPKKGIRIDCPKCGYYPIERLAVVVNGKPKKVELTCSSCGHSYISASIKAWKEAEQLAKYGKIKT